MRSRKTLFIALLFIFIGIFLKKYWRTSDYLETIYFDLTNNNPTITTKKELNQILNNFKSISTKDLPAEYLDYSKMKDPKHQNMTKGMRFYKINKKDCYKKIVGDFRVRNGERINYHSWPILFLSNFVENTRRNPAMPAFFALLEKKIIHPRTSIYSFTVPKGICGQG